GSAPCASPRGDTAPKPYDRRPLIDAPGAPPNGSNGVTRPPLREPPAEPPGAPTREPVVPLAPPRGGAASFTAVAVNPPAMLACPLLSHLQRSITPPAQP